MATKQATKYKEQGNKAFKEGNHAKAIEYYTYATELDPKNPIFFTNRSTAYYKMNKFDKSLRDANKAIKLDSNWAKGFYRRAMALVELEQVKEAIPDFEKAARLKPDYPSYREQLAKARELLHKGMCNAEIIKLQANEMFKAGQIEKAIMKYTEAIHSCRKNPKEDLVKADCYANRAACHRQLYASKKVVHDCTEALKLNPNHVKALIRRAQAHESLENFKESLNDFQQANYLANTPVATQGAARIRSALRREAKMNL